MKRYLKLIVSLIKNNLIRETEFRGNFIISTITALAWTVFQVFIVEIYFQFTNNIMGWKVWEIFIYVGIFRIIKSFFDMFPRTNLFDFPDSVSRGELDYSLTRPINALFLISFRRHMYKEISSLIGGIATLIYGLSIGGITLGLINWAVLLITALFGLLAYYSIFLFIAALSIFTIRMTALREINNSFAGALRYPSVVFSRGNHLFEVVLIPLSIVSTFPAQSFLNKASPAMVFIEIFLCTSLFILVYRFWNFTLRHYSSASS